MRIRVGRRFGLGVAATAFALAIAGASSAFNVSLVANGNFETGNLASWTTFTTSNGTINGGDVQLFDTTGTGASYAAHFNVGEVVFVNTGAGGGIYQNFFGQPYKVSADVAAHNPDSSSNNACGYFELLLDNVVVASHNFGACGGNATVRAHLAGVVSTASGSHQVRVRITRPYVTLLGVTPEQYVDNVVVTAKIAKV